MYKMNTKHISTLVDSENRASCDLSWPKVGLEPKFHDPGTFGGFGKHEQTDTQDSCFISID